jgi:dihydrofolate reductase
VTIVNESELFVTELKTKPGKDTWLFGGGELFQSLLRAGLVDGDRCGRHSSAARRRRAAVAE